MNFARFSVTRPVAVTMRIAALVLLGAVCFTRLPVDLLPEVSLPTVLVATEWPNVAPEEMEAQITRPLEEAVGSVPNLYEVSSTTGQGRSSVRVQFQWGTDVGEASVNVLQQVERARRQFPTDPTLQTPVVIRLDPNQLPILIYGVSGEDDPVKLRTLLDEQVAPLLSSANGVAAVTVTGGQERAIRVEVDPERLRAHGLSLRDITRRLAQENQNLPGGIGKESDTEYTLRSMGWFTSPREIAQVPIGNVNGRLVSLGDVAKVSDTTPERRIYTRLNGDNAVGIIITKQSGANTVAATQAIQQKIEQVKKLYPQLNFGLAYDQSQFIRASVHSVQEHAIIGGALAILILLFFLRNLRSTFVVALSIPISIVSTFALLYICGFTLNTMSLSGLALATGLIVDDAVVVLENIFRHIERDRKGVAEAAVTGTQEIASAVVASTLTIMVVFMPLLLIKGQAGQMFTQLALVVIFSIAVSLLDALTVVPMLASRMITADAHGSEHSPEARNTLMGRFFHWSGEKFDAIDEGYRNGLRWTLRHRWFIMVGAATVTVGAFLLLPLVGTEMMPRTDSGDFSVNVKMPVGTSLETTERTMRRVEEIVQKNPNVQTAFAAAGTTLSLRGTTTAEIGYQGSVTVKLKRERNASTQEVIDAIRRETGRIPGARVRINQVDLVNQIISGGAQNVEVNIFGEDLKQLSALARDGMQRFREVPGLENVDVNWQEATPEIQWKIDREKALQMGVTFEDVASSIGTATRGTIASYYQEAGFQYPIIVQLPENKRKTIDALLDMPVRPSLGGASKDIALRQVATATYGVGPSEITRLSRQRYIAIQGTPEGRAPSEVQADIEKVMNGVDFPEGYYWAWGSAQQRRDEEFAGMGLAVILAIALIYMLLASQFESFIHPLTVLVTVPLSAAGVLLALFLTGRPFGLTAFIGLLLLVGIVVKSGILLVDYTNVLRARGLPRDEAILTAGPTRLRPILMTSLATFFGMLPMALGLGEGSETLAPMATAVLGGLTTSTLLTLFVVPTVYTLFDDVARRLRRDNLDLAPPALIEPSVGSVEREPLSREPSDTPTTV